MAYTFDPDTMSIFITGAASGDGLAKYTQELIKSPDNGGTCESDYKYVIKGTVSLINEPVSVALQSSGNITRANTSDCL